MDLRDELLKLSENDLRKKIIIPLLKALGAYHVEDFHGPREKGKDVYFSYKNIFGRYKHCCFFIKKGNIKKTGKNDVRKCQNAIEEAIKIELINPIDNKSSVRIEEFYFVCSGRINQEAREWLNEFLVKQKIVPNCDIFDGESLIQFILDLIKKYIGLMRCSYKFNIATFEDYAERIISYNQMNYSEYPIYNHSEGNLFKS
jgi:hypothetical protein